MIRKPESTKKARTPKLALKTENKLTVIGSVAASIMPTWEVTTSKAEIARIALKPIIFFNLVPRYSSLL